MKNINQEEELFLQPNIGEKAGRFVTESFGSSLTKKNFDIEEGEIDEN